VLGDAVNLLTGALPSHDPNDFDFHTSESYAGASPEPARDYDFRHLHTWRVQQAPSCVAYSMAAKAQALAKAQGNALPLLCANWNWTGARMIASPPKPGSTLPIIGSHGHFNMRHARDRGFKAENVFPDVPENHDRVPEALVWGTPALAKLDRWSRIKGEGDPDKLRDGIMNAFRLLERGQCSFPGAVFEVGNTFANWPEGQAWDGTVGSHAGRHDQAIGLYRAVDDCVGLLSSWSERVYWVPIPLLARIGTWFTVIESLVYPEAP